jgi:hypothetical protein
MDFWFRLIGEPPRIVAASEAKRVRRFMIASFVLVVLEHRARDSTPHNHARSKIHWSVDIFIVESSEYVVLTIFIARADASGCPVRCRLA